MFIGNSRGGTNFIESRMCLKLSDNTNTQKKSTSVSAIHMALKEPDHRKLSYKHSQQVNGEILKSQKSKMCHGVALKAYLPEGLGLLITKHTTIMTTINSRNAATTTVHHMVLKNPAA